MLSAEPHGPRVLLNFKMRKGFFHLVIKLSFTDPSLSNQRNALFFASGVLGLPRYVADEFYNFVIGAELVRRNLRLPASRRFPENEVPVAVASTCPFSQQTDAFVLLLGTDCHLDVSSDCLKVV